ncbi:MAG: glycoside hydrolase family 3 C-terminal domain-containing protein, partial [Gemmatimonadales bacterium]
TRRSIVLVKDSAGLVRSLRAAPRRLGVVALGDDVGGTLAFALREAGRPVDLFRLYPASGPASYDSAYAMLQQNEVAIFATSVRASAWSGNIALPEAVARLIDSTARTRPTVLLSFGSPYVISQTPSAWSYMLGWSPRPENERAVADALAGRAPITGRLPASIPPYFPIGTGIQEKR